MIKRAIWPFFSVALPFQALRRSLAWDTSLLFGASGTWRGPLAGVLLFSSVRQHLMGQPLVQLPMLVCGEREARVMAPPTRCNSAVSPCFHGCLAFLHRHFPPSHPLNPSLRSQQQLSPWDCSTIPKFHLPVTAPSRRGWAFLYGVCMTAARTV